METFLVVASGLMVTLALATFALALFIFVKAFALVPQMLFQMKQTQMALGIVSAEREEDEPPTPTVTTPLRQNYADEDYIEAIRAARQGPADVLNVNDNDRVAPETFEPGSLFKR